MSSTREDSTSIREEIIAVAEKMFRDWGYKNTTFQKIAVEFGISKSTSSYHFGNKYLLLLYMLDDYFQYLRSFIDSYPQEYRNAY